MKVIYLIAIILIHFDLHGQVDSLGIDNNKTLLTEIEANYLNDKFNKERGQFNFKNKRIVFVTGSGGSKRITKNKYFDDVRLWNEHNSEIVSSLIIFTNEEKENSGHDAIITAWVKVLTNKRRKQILNELKNSR